MRTNTSDLAIPLKDFPVTDPEPHDETAKTVGLSKKISQLKLNDYLPHLDLGYEYNSNDIWWAIQAGLAQRKYAFKENHRYILEVNRNDYLAVTPPVDGTGQGISSKRDSRIKLP